VGIKIKGGCSTLSLPNNQIVEAHEEFWRWVFREDDGPNHPLKASNNGRAQIQRGRLLILAGSLPDSVQRNRLLQIPNGVDNIFVPAENCVYTEADGDGQSNQELIDKANKDMDDSQGEVWVNQDKQKLERLPAHAFDPLLKIERCIDGAGKVGSGEGESCRTGSPPGPTKAAASCDYAIIPANTLKSGYKIRIKGIGRAGPNQKPGRIDVTYEVQ
jgi:hypothetical protein